MRKGLAHNVAYYLLRTAAMLAAAIAVIIFVVGQIENHQLGGGIPIVSPTSNQVAVLPSVTLTPIPDTAMPTPTETMDMTATPIPVLSTASATQPVTLISPTSQEAIVVIEGQVSNIVGNVVTVNGFDVEVAPNHPILQIIEVGDSLHVEGVLSGSSKIIPRLISNLSNTTISDTSKPVTVGLDGPVEAIKDNLVTVNGITVRFEPDDPILKTLTVGNFVSIKGNFSGSDASMVLVVVNVTVFNNITVIDNNCWFDPGPDAGMGDPAMGMEDPAMGMGKRPSRP
jgi:hypothetical protein